MTNMDETILNKQTVLSRVPRTVGATESIIMRLCPEEKKQLNDISRQSGRSLSSTARLIYLCGLNVMQQDKGNILSFSLKK